MVLGVAALLGVLQSGCVATNEDVRGVYLRQARIEEKVARLSRELDELRGRAGVSGGVADETELAARVEKLEEEIRLLSRRLDSIEHGGVAAGPSTTLAAPPAEVTAPAPTPTPTPTPVAARPATALFAEGYDALAHGKYADARSLFKEYLKENPSSAQAADAAYWIAESYYREGRYEEAILEFQNFIDNYSRDDRVPLAYLKQGLSLIKIKRPEEAKIFLETLIDKFPDSEEAVIAKQRLVELAKKGQ